MRAHGAAPRSERYAPLHPHFDHDLVHAGLVSAPMHCGRYFITTFDVGVSSNDVQSPCSRSPTVCVNYNSLSNRTSACAA